MSLGLTGNTGGRWHGSGMWDRKPGINQALNLLFPAMPCDRQIALASFDPCHCSIEKLPSLTGAVVAARRWLSAENVQVTSNVIVLRVSNAYWPTVDDKHPAWFYTKTIGVMVVQCILGHAGLYIINNSSSGCQGPSTIQSLATKSSSTWSSVVSSAGSERGGLRRLRRGGYRGGGVQRSSAEVPWARVTRDKVCMAGGLELLPAAYLFAATSI